MVKHSLVCAAPDGSVASASGVAIVASCKARKGESELLLFATAKTARRSATPRWPMVDDW